MAKQQTPLTDNAEQIDAENMARFNLGHRGDPNSDPIKAGIEKAIPLRVTGTVDPKTGLTQKTVVKNER